MTVYTFHAWILRQVDLSESKKDDNEYDYSDIAPLL